MRFGTGIILNFLIVIFFGAGIALFFKLWILNKFEMCFIVVSILGIIAVGTVLGICLYFGKIHNKKQDANDEEGEQDE